MDMERMEEYQIPQEAMERIKDPEILRKQIEEGKTLQEIFDYTDEVMEKFYNAAYTLFRKEEWKKAADAFLFLTSLNPYVHTYWLGLGMSEQLKGENQGALLAYAMAILTDVTNPVPHYHSGNCYLQMGEKVSAKSSFELAIECCKQANGHEGILSSATRALERMK